MKLAVLLPVILILAAILAAPALAGNAVQDLPPTAAEGVGLIEAGLALLAGLAGWAVTDAIRKVAWLTEEDKSAIAGPAANLVAAISSVISGLVIGYLGQAAGFLDQNGLWAVVLFAWPMAKGWFEATGWRKAIETWFALRLEPVKEYTAGGPGSYTGENIGPGSR